MFAALNSVEAAILPWSIFVFSGDSTQTPGREQLDAFLQGRLQRMKAVMADRTWLAGRFERRPNFDI